MASAAFAALMPTAAEQAMAGLRAAALEQTAALERAFAALMPPNLEQTFADLMPTVTVPAVLTEIATDLERFGRLIAETVTAERARRRRVGRDAIAACDRRRALIVAGLEAIAPPVLSSTPAPIEPPPTALEPVTVPCAALEAVTACVATPNGPPASAVISSTPTDHTGGPPEP